MNSESQYTETKAVSVRAPIEKPCGERVQNAPKDEGTPIHSEQLFAGRQRVTILHAGGLYQLQQTRLGKLILTK